MSFLSKVGQFFMGKPGKYQQRSTLSPEQQRLAQQYFNSISGRGGGGAFGDVADYYRNMLSDNPEDFAAFAAPEMRRFREETIPGLSEQFAGMGSGALSSSGFRNAAVGAGADLQERLGAIRAQLRQAAAQGLQGFAQGGLNPSFQENVYTAGQPGFLDFASQAFGGAAPGLGGFVGGAASNWLRNRRADTSQIYQGGQSQGGFGGGGR